MKKLIAAALLVVGMTAFAQEKAERPGHAEKKERPEMAKLTQEQKNQLRLKELTLKLDLNASQQKEFATIISETGAKREAAMAERKADKGKKLTSDELFARRNKMLDEQIAMKEKVKKILSPEQMDKWEKMQQHGKMAMRGKRSPIGPKK